MNEKANTERKNLTKNRHAKKERLKLINEKDVKTLERYANGVLPSERAKAGMFYGRFRDRFLKTVETLAYASTLLPEKEKERALTFETLKPLVEALLTFEPQEETEMVKNKRAFMVAYLFANWGEERGFDMLKNPYDVLLYENLRCKTKAMMLISQLGQFR